MGQPPLTLPTAPPTALEVAQPSTSLSKGLNKDTEIQSAPPTGTTDENSTEAQTNSLRPFSEAIEGFTRLEGLLTLYQNLDSNQLLLALRPEQLNQNFLFLATLESGLGEWGLFRGWDIDDFLLQFRRVPGNKLQIVVPNLNFRSGPGSGQERRLLNESFSDSPIATLNIVSIEDKSGLLLVDFGAFLLNRDPADLVAQFPWVFGGYSFNTEASYLETAQPFPQNVELAAVLSFSGGGSSNPLSFLFSPSLETLADARGFNLRMRYSFSQLPENPRYQPRLADERVGYFLTAFRAPAQARARESFTRYIHRWHLEKQDPTAALSRPQSPIVFWIENTVPTEYRQAIREGVLMWNEAFEQAGFRDAIAVRQMPNDADWDPADTRYNVIRWSDSFGSGVLGYGPSRVNPLTGEILDADVVLDANVVSYLQREYQDFVGPLSTQAETYLQLCGRPFRSVYHQWLLSQAQGSQPATATPRTAQVLAAESAAADRCAGYSAAQQVAFGSLALDLLGAPFTPSEVFKTYVHDYLKSLTAHEVGHVLGLRHNFLGSTLNTPEDLNNAELTHSQGLVSSVMDYFPPNLALDSSAQGDFFPTRLGPYDLWAIEYGYKPLQGRLSQFDQSSLQSIAQRSGTPELAYATDEDIYDFLNPQAAAWDLSSDPLQYAQWQMENAQAIWKKLNWYSVRPGEGYGQLRRRFDLIMGYYQHQMFTISNYIGGQQFTRTNPWDSRGQQPFAPISAEKQRQALDLLEKYVLSPDAFNFSPDLLNSLAPDRWNHWGQSLTVYPLDYPAYDRILFVQGMALNDLFFADRLRRLRDGELKAGPTATLSLPELFERVNQMVWSEVLTTDGQPPALTSLRRGLQRHHLTLLSSLVLRHSLSDLEGAQDLLEAIGIGSTLGAPEDARVMARYQLQRLGDAIATTLRRQGDRLDISTRAHLEDARDRIGKTLNAPLQSG
ncbi:zinc-dependent metalloprotease [Pseudanabaena sp. FACHB-2040]|uniref:zinc-dependent metalloprotease n=1 Tax=Pseudanabaena sp. FACHB-2040 TaxID=2692859 RepID=UPI00168404F7|nr:zinc-dependent metalloprotease [Pseudanabaena sp. FACHB-2040]MBD2260696.1 zinc-dependent metalloprotease [Pseudanabaena sp. FACHB-2040]